MMIDDSRYAADFESCRLLVESRLAEFFADNCSYEGLLDSMRYSLLAGGKRVRAVICMKFCEAAGGDPMRALDAACAIEMLHAYTLIHDDLPCMDDDDLRRGLPSNHIKYGDATALLAGDALQAAAFDTLLSSSLPFSGIVDASRILARVAGPHGICGGQFLDLRGVGKSLSEAELRELYLLKSASLISAAAEIGVVVAGGSREQIGAAGDFGSAVGFAFQVRDDLLDYSSSSLALGKPVGSDRDNNKVTFASLFSLNECEELIRLQSDIAVSAISRFFSDVGFLSWLVGFLAGRLS